MGKITDNSDELSFHELTSRSSMLLVPLFQRQYVWTQKQLSRMISEIESIASKKDVNRFLGAIIAVNEAYQPFATNTFGDCRRPATPHDHVSVSLGRCTGGCKRGQN